MKGQVQKRQVLEKCRLFLFLSLFACSLACHAETMLLVEAWGRKGSRRKQEYRKKAQAHRHKGTGMGTHGRLQIVLHAKRVGRSETRSDEG